MSYKYKEEFIDMKKTLLVLLVGLLVLAGCTSGKDASTLTVASPSKQPGDFVAGFSSDSVDRWGRDLMGGYGTHFVNPQTAELQLDESVVEDLKIDTDAATGNKTYTYKIKEGLKFSNGDPVKSDHYVFSVLLRANPAWREVATSDSTGQDLLGYKEYVSGESDTFAGVKRIDDYSFSLTIDGNALPYYFEEVIVSASPEPMQVWFPEGKFNAEGNGFDNTVEELKKAVDYVATTERYKPTVVTGPYVMESFENNTSVFVRNEEYQGNFEGKKPEIDKVVIRLVQANVVVQSIEKGEVDLSPGNIEADIITKAKELDLQLHSYPRNGYGMIQFKANKAPTDLKEVRQAIGYIVNRNEFVQKIVGGYGVAVNGPFGLSQWFYQENKDELKEKLHEYTYNPTKANELLDQTDYKFEADGVTPFDVSKASNTGDYYRYNSNKEQLRIDHFGSEDNAVTDLIVSQIVPAAKEVGMNYVVDQGDFATLGAYMQGIEENDYNAFNLATGFTAIYDPYTGHHSDWVGKGPNWGDFADPELDAAIEKLRGTEPSDREGFSKAIVEYFELWNDLLPSLPLYANEYFDIASPRVKGLDFITPEVDWAQTINYISLEK